MIRRIVVSLIMVGSLLLAACGAAPGAPSNAAPAAAEAPAATGPEPVTILFENYNLASAGIGRDATEAMLAEFSRQFPHITVETKATGSQEVMASVQAQIAAGSPPDVAQVLLREWDIVVENMSPVPLETIVPADEWAEHTEAIYPRAMNLTRRGDMTYGMPYVFSTPTLFYNASLFSAAGLDPANPPRTWAEVQAAALQIKEATGKEGLYIACIELDWCAQAILLSNGGRFLSDDRTQVLFGEPEAVEALTIWQELINSGAHVKLSGNEALDAFKAGNVAMYLNTSAVQGSLISAAEGNWELQATGMPSFGDQPAVPTNSGSGLAILTQDPAKQRAAWEIVKFLTGDYAFTVIARDIGYLPLRPAILEDERYLKDWIVENPQILPNLEQLEYLEPSVAFPGPNHVQIRDIYLKAQEEVLLFGADPAATMQAAQARAMELMP